jgi:hypothetical protein
MKVTKWSTFCGDLAVSEQKADPVTDLSADSIDLEPNASTPSNPTSLESTPPASPEPTLGSINIESPKLVPEPGGSAEAPKETHQEEAKEAASKVEAAKTDAPRRTGKIMIMSRVRDDAYGNSYEGPWTKDTGEEASGQDVRNSGIFGKRRLSALAAVIALAAVSGAIGGALATAGLGQYLGQSSGSDETRTASLQNRAVEESITRIDAELAALKRLGLAQSTKVNDRLDKVEKAQAEPVAKLAKLSEAVEKLRVPAPPVPAPVAAMPASKETTGSITPPALAPKPEIARLPTVENWVLRDVANGSALIEGRRGMFEVFAGDPIPGLGRVDAIRRQDGRWVVVTSKGLIVAR